jgi:hypothetical protein
MLPLLLLTSVTLPNSIRELAQQEGISINQFITLAVAEKMSALMTEDYLAERAKRGGRAKYETVLVKVLKGKKA